MKTTKCGKCGLQAVLLVILALSPAAAGELTVAFYDFETKERGLEKNSALVRDLAEVRLSTESGLKVVTRSDMAKILEENKIGLAGLSEQDVPRIGKLIGAQVMIVGRLFLVQEQLFITARIFSVETSRAFAVSAKGDPEKLDTLTEELVGSILNVLNQNAGEFRAPQVTLEDRMNALKTALGDGALPGVFIYLPERHVSQPAIDPAAQTEIETILNQAGFDLFTDSDNNLNKWARSYLAKQESGAPRVEGVDIILIGEAFSEFAARTGELVTCKARVEIKAIDVKSGKVLAVDSETFRATDLSEHIAAKAALQQAAAGLAFRLLPETVRKWRETQS